MVALPLAQFKVTPQKDLASIEVHDSQGNVTEKWTFSQYNKVVGSISLPQLTVFERFLPLDGDDPKAGRFCRERRTYRLGESKVADEEEMSKMIARFAAFGPFTVSDARFDSRGSSLLPAVLSLSKSSKPHQGKVVAPCEDKETTGEKRGFDIYFPRAIPSGIFFMIGLWIMRAARYRGPRE